MGERVIGVLALASTLPLSYTAAQLKLLGTLGLQAATAIENARLFERTVQAAAERERLLRLHKETEVARAKLESELTLAARIQADLFPAALPAVPGYQLAAHNRPARQCGGDYYDAIALCRRGPRAVVRGRRVGQGTAGRARHEQHAGNAARAPRSSGVTAGAGGRVERAALCHDRPGEVRDGGPGWFSRRPPEIRASWAPDTSIR